MRFSRRGDVNPFIVMDVMEDARRAEAAGASVIHMEVGQPGAPAPRPAREAARRAIASDPLGYTVALGLPELRERIAKLYRDWYGLGSCARGSRNCTGTGTVSTCPPRGSS